MHRSALLLALSGALTFAAAADEPETPPVPRGPASVTLSLAEYERIRNLDGRASVTVVDVLRLGGSFGARSLTISFSGRTSGRRPAETVLVGDEGVSVYGCTGDGIVSKSDEGFALTPLAAKFEVRCRIGSRGTDRVELRLPKAVLWAESDVTDGELVTGAGDDGGRAVSVVRRTAPSREALPASATGRYRISLRPDETRFTYAIDARNPNRGRQILTLDLHSGESVLKVDAAVPYEADGGVYRFTLPPGDTRLTLAGTLRGREFTPPVGAAVQYVLLESHPLLQASVTGEKKRVSPDEVGLAAEFRGAQAFLLGRDESLAWDATRMEALRTTSFALRRESHVLFVPAEGPSLGESAFALDNQGAADVTLALTPMPTFAGLSGEPLLLTKTAAGELRVPLGRGVQELSLQHRQGLSTTLGFAHGTMRMPRLGAPATHTSVEVRYPAEWVPLYEGFASEGRFHVPGRGTLLWGVLLLLLTERSLALLGLPAGPRAATALLSALAGLVSPDAGRLLVLLDAAVLGLVLAGAFRRIVWSGPRVALGLALAVVLALAALLSSTSTRISTQPQDVELPLRAAQEGQLKSQVARAADASSPASPALADAPAFSTAYQGLPARFELPGGATRVRFDRELLPADGLREVRVLAIARPLAAALSAALVLAAAAAFVRARRELASGLKSRLVDVRAAFAPPAPVPVS